MLPPDLRIDSEPALVAALTALEALDPHTIGHLLRFAGAPPLRRREPGFEGLAWIIVSQQLSTASAGAIFARLKTRVDPFDAAVLARLDDEALRGCGLSGPKIRTLRSLCTEVADGRLDLAALTHMPADLAHAALVTVKGIGPWTADIFLLFCLGHPDAFPAGDLALQEAARLALALRKRPDAAKLTKIAERWRPWRGAAARLLWAYYRVAKAREGMALAGST
jgi:DNA-3-methyladenine glycosylase II